MKRYLQIASFIYVSLALLIATQSLASFEAPVKRNPDQRGITESPQPALQNYQRLARSGRKTEKANYTIEVWTARWCGACQRYKRIELPALLKAGFNVKVLDYDKDNPPSSITSVPTIRLYYKGTFLKQEVYWKAADINKFVENRMTLKQ